MTGRRQFVEMLIAFVVGLFLGQQEKPISRRTTIDLHGLLMESEKPGKIKLECAPSSVQYDFPLDPVALDVDGKVKHPNETSYAPQIHWDTKRPHTTLQELSGAGGFSVKYEDKIVKFYRLRSTL